LKIGKMKRTVTLSYGTYEITWEEQKKIVKDLEFLIHLSSLPIQIRDKENPDNDEERRIFIKRGNYSAGDGNLFRYEVIDKEVIGRFAFPYRNGKYTSAEIKDLIGETGMEGEWSGGGDI